MIDVFPKTRLDTPDFGIIGGTNKGAGAVLETPSRVTKRHWRSLVMESYSQLSFTEQVKRCTRCKAIKPLCEFHRNRTKSDGLHDVCKPCNCAVTREWRIAHPKQVKATRDAYRAANIDRIREYDRTRSRRHNHYYRESRRAYYLANKEKIAASDKAYRERNREAILERERAAYHANREKYLAQMQAYRERNREKAAQTAKAWREKNRDRFLASIKDRKYRLRTVQQVGDQETNQFLTAIRHDPCSYCGNAGGTVDHIVPISKGGQHHWSNFAGACMECNNQKKAMSLLTYLHRSNRRKVV